MFYDYEIKVKLKKKKKKTRFNASFRCCTSAEENSIPYCMHNQSKMLTTAEHCWHPYNWGCRLTTIMNKCHNELLSQLTHGHFPDEDGLELQLLDWLLETLMVQGAFTIIQNTLLSFWNNLLPSFWRLVNPPEILSVDTFFPLTEKKIHLNKCHSSKITMLMQILSKLLILILDLKWPL